MATAQANDDAELKLRLNQIAQAATQAEDEHGVDVAIAIYEEALLEPDNQDYGALHLRLGQLQKKKGNMTAAAYHFGKCMRDDRVDALDRDVICTTGFESTTARLDVVNLPYDSVLTVVEPPQFAGRFKSGDRLPKGAIRIKVVAPGQEDSVHTIVLNQDYTWHGKTGLKVREGPLVPDDFVSDDTAEPEPDFARSPRVDARRSETKKSKAIRWPSYVTAALGAGLIGTGLAVGIDNQSYLEGIRKREDAGLCAVHYCIQDFNTAYNRAKLADGLWIGGAITMATSVAFWFLFDGDSDE